MSSPSDRAETKIIHITVLQSRNKDYYSHNCVTYIHIMPGMSSSPSERAETKIIHITVLHRDNAKDVFFSI